MPNEPTSSRTSRVIPNVRDHPATFPVLPIQRILVPTPEHHASESLSTPSRLPDTFTTHLKAPVYVPTSCQSYRTSRRLLASPPLRLTTSFPTIRPHYMYIPRCYTHLRSLRIYTIRD